MKVYLEALGERQKNVGSFVSGAWLCDHPKFGLFRPVVGQRLRNLLLQLVSFNFWVQLTPNNRIYMQLQKGQFFSLKSELDHFSFSAIIMYKNRYNHLGPFMTKETPNLQEKNH